jgi:AAHS family 4-hydroxybenzoate transporter-like MFS transporter
MREWGVPRSAFAPLVSLGYLGMMIGGARLPASPAIGSDGGPRCSGAWRCFGAMTLAAVTRDRPLLNSAGCACWPGIGLGGAMPNAAALVAEFVPLRQRPDRRHRHDRLRSARRDDRRSALESACCLLLDGACCF